MIRRGGLARTGLPATPVPSRQTRPWSCQALLDPPRILGSASGCLRNLCFGAVMVVTVGGPLTACSRAGGPADLVELATDTPPPGLSPLHLDFGGKIELVGASVTPQAREYAVGDALTVTLVWKPLAAIEPGWSIFTHVVGPKDMLVANLDGSGPLRQKYSGEGAAALLSRMQVGKYYRDQLSFSIAQEVPSVLTVVAGIQKGNERLLTKGGDANGGVAVARLAVASKARTAIKELVATKLAPGVVVTIDGRLDEPAWATAADTGPFVDVGSGQSNPGIPVQGRAKLAWDDQFLYVGFEIKDKRVHGGWPAGAKDPHLWEKDTVEIMIDPDGDGDNKDYYEIQINPQNLVFDTQYDDYNFPNGNGRGPFGHEEWSAGLTSAVQVHGTIDNDADVDEGYTVETKIPWVSFTKAHPSPPALGSTWRMNFYAMKSNGGTAWSPILGMGNFHRASRFGRVRWVAGR